jgi:integrase
LRQLSKKHIATKAAVLPADGLLKYLNHDAQSLVDRQDRAMALVAFFGCLRGCELVCIELSQLDFMRDGVMVTITRFKTTNKPMRFLIPTTLPELAISPATILREYIDAVKPWLEQHKLVRIWPRPTSNSFMTQFRGKNYIATIAKKIAVFLKLDPTSYTGHSFRRSAATAAADSGISLINLKRFGGWKSDSVAASYVDDSLAATKSAANMLLPSPAIVAKSIIPETASKPESKDTKGLIQMMSKPIDNVQSDAATSITAPKNANVVFNFYVNSN